MYHMYNKLIGLLFLTVFFLFLVFLLIGLWVTKFVSGKLEIVDKRKRLLVWTVWCGTFPIFFWTSLSLFNPVTIFWRLLSLPVLYGNLYVWVGIGVLWIVGAPIVWTGKIYEV